MSLPTIFANLSAATGAQLDANFAALGNNIVLPCTIAGTNTLALTLASNTPTIAAYANYMVFSGVFTDTNTGAMTAQVGSLPALNVYKDSTTGPLALTGGEAVAGNIGMFVYDSTLNTGAGGFHLQFVQTNAVGVSVGIRGAFNNLTASATGASATLTVSATEIMVENAANQYVTLRNVSLTANTGSASGAANSLDTGSWAYSTWYNTFVIYGGSGTALLWSLSATAPTLPSGYAYFARIGTIRTPSATNYYPLGFTQKGRKVRYLVSSGGNVTALPFMASGSAGNPALPTYVSVAWGAYAPPTTAVLTLLLFTQSYFGIAAPNNSYGTYATVTNPPPMSNGPAGGTGTGIYSWGEIVPESTSIYWASNDSVGFLACVGWEDNL